MTVLKSSIKMEARDIAKASDMLNISLLSRKVKNIIYVTCVPKTTDIK